MTGYARSEAEFAAERYRRDPRPASLAPKDYSVPLHVDCSIEYELPDCAKPPQGVKIEPLLMIHPAHFRRLESLRRVPFVNNLPRGEHAAAAAAVAASAAAPTPPRARLQRPPRRCCRAAPAPVAAAPAPTPAAARRGPDELAASCYRLEALEALEAGAGKAAAAAARARVLRAHPYACERFDTRALQQLPVYL